MKNSHVAAHKRGAGLVRKAVAFGCSAAMVLAFTPTAAFAAAGTKLAEGEETQQEQTGGQEQAQVDYTPIVAPLVNKTDEGSELVNAPGYGITAAAPVDKDEYKEIAVTVTGTVPEHKATTGTMPTGHWVGIGVPQAIKGDATSGVKYYTGFGGYDASNNAGTANNGNGTPDSANYKVADDGPSYDTLYFDVKSAAAKDNKAFIVVKSGEDDSASIIALYTLDLSGVGIGYYVELEKADHGKISINGKDKALAAVGKTVTVTATPDTGYELKSLTWKKKTEAAEDTGNTETGGDNSGSDSGNTESGNGNSGDNNSGNENSGTENSDNTGGSGATTAEGEGETPATGTGGTDTPSTEQPASDQPASEDKDAPAEKTTETVTGNSFTMPAFDVTVTATFDKVVIANNQKATTADGKNEVQKTSGTTVTYVAPKVVSSSVTVPDEVKLADGSTYKVTKVAAGAFKGLSKVSQVTVGKNVTTVDGKAFNNMKALTKVTLGDALTKLGKGSFTNTPKLKTIVVKSTKLKKASVKGALKGAKLKKTITIKVPKKQLKSYKKKVFTKKNLGANKKVKVKK